MAEKLEDLNLPLPVIARLIKESLPEEISVTKEGQTAVARAASVFVLYIAASANTIAKSNKRKTINKDDVYQAIRDADYDYMEGPLKAFEEIKKDQKAKKEATVQKRESKGRRTETSDDEFEDSTE